VTGTEAGPSARLEHISSARLLWGDALIASKLLNHARHRVMAGVFGVTRGESKLNDSNILTLLAFAAFASALRRTAAAPREQVRKAQSSPNRVANTMIGAAAVRETVDGIAGHPSRDTSSAVALIAFAVVAHSTRPAVERSLHAVRQALTRLRAEIRRGWAEVRQWGI
jgi:hypothetical protein